MAPAPDEAFEATLREFRELYAQKRRLAAGGAEQVATRGGPTAGAIDLALANARGALHAALFRDTFLETQPARVAASENRGDDSILSLAIRERDLDTVAMLLEAGVDVRYRPGAASCPLGVAVHTDSLEMVQMLIDAGAEPNDQAAERTVLKIAPLGSAIREALTTAGAYDSYKREASCWWKVAVWIGVSFEQMESGIDHDFTEEGGGHSTVYDALVGFSYSASYAHAAVGAAETQGVTTTEFAAVAYHTDHGGKTGPLAEHPGGYFLGTFPFDPFARSANAAERCGPYVMPDGAAGDRVRTIRAGVASTLVERGVPIDAVIAHIRRCLGTITRRARTRPSKPVLYVAATAVDGLVNLARSALARASDVDSAVGDLERSLREALTAHGRPAFARALGMGVFCSAAIHGAEVVFDTSKPGARTLLAVIPSTESMPESRV